MANRFLENLIFPKYIAFCGFPLDVAVVTIQAVDIFVDTHILMQLFKSALSLSIGKMKGFW